MPNKGRPETKAARKSTSRKPASKKATFKVGRSAKSGKFMPVEKAKGKATAVVETMKKASKTKPKKR